MTFDSGRYDGVGILVAKGGTFHIIREGFNLSLCGRKRSEGAVLGPDEVLKTRESYKLICGECATEFASVAAEIDAMIAETAKRSEQQH